MEWWGSGFWLITHSIDVGLSFVITHFQNNEDLILSYFLDEWINILAQSLWAMDENSQKNNFDMILKLLLISCIGINLEWKSKFICGLILISMKIYFVFVIPAWIKIKPLHGMNCKEKSIYIHQTMINSELQPFLLGEAKLVCRHHMNKKNKNTKKRHTKMHEVLLVPLNGVTLLLPNRKGY